MEAEPARAQLAEDYPDWRIWRNGVVVYGWLQPPGWQPLRLVAATVEALRTQVEFVEAVRRDFPEWEVWEAVMGAQYYAKRPRSSPPMVAGPVPLEGLHEAIGAVLEARARGRMPG